MPENMDDLISIENLVEQAKQKGIDFGKGDPYNRLRYYTKIGWLPHMERKKDTKGATSGHYPSWTIDRLVEIEKLKSAGFSNEEISTKLKVKSKLQFFLEYVSSKEIRLQVITYASLIMLVLIFANEFGIIRFGNPKPNFLDTGTSAMLDNAPKQVIESGTAFVPKNQKKLFIQTQLVKKQYKVYITFNQEYSPATRYWVSNVEDYKGFTIELDAPVFNNVEFSWWITN